MADLSNVWEAHLRGEFATRDADATMETMVEDPYVNHIPVMTGGFGREQVREFYAAHFIPRLPPDTVTIPISRTVGEDRLVDELILRFTHTCEVDFMLPGIPPTGKVVESPTVVVIQFRDGKVAHEHIYWDQASVLVQLGLLDPGELPIAGAEIVRKLDDPSRPSNELVRRAAERRATAGG